MIVGADLHANPVLGIANQPMKSSATSRIAKFQRPSPRGKRDPNCEVRITRCACTLRWEAAGQLGKQVTPYWEECPH